MIFEQAILHRHHPPPPTLTSPPNRSNLATSCDKAAGTVHRGASEPGLERFSTRRSRRVSPLLPGLLETSSPSVTNANGTLGPMPPVRGFCVWGPGFPQRRLRIAAFCASGAHDPKGRCAPVLEIHHPRSPLRKPRTPNPSPILPVFPQDKRGGGPPAKLVVEGFLQARNHLTLLRCSKTQSTLGTEVGSCTPSTVVGVEH